MSPIVDQQSMNLFYVNELIDPARTRLKENSYDPT